MVKGEFFNIGLGKEAVEQRELCGIAKPQRHNTAFQTNQIAYNDLVAGNLYDGESVGRTHLKYPHVVQEVDKDGRYRNRSASLLLLTLAFQLLVQIVDAVVPRAEVFLLRLNLLRRSEWTTLRFNLEPALAPSRPTNLLLASSIPRPVGP